jgi:hypothetical protein
MESAVAGTMAIEDEILAFEAMPALEAAVDVAIIVTVVPLVVTGGAV